MCHPKENGPIGVCGKPGSVFVRNWAGMSTTISFLLPVLFGLAAPPRAQAQAQPDAVISPPYVYFYIDGQQILIPKAQWKIISNVCGEPVFTGSGNSLTKSWVECAEGVLTMLENASGGEGGSNALHFMTRPPEDASPGFTPALNSGTPYLPFLGNRLVEVGFLPNTTNIANTTAVYTTDLRRNSDCSLDEDFILPTATTPSTAVIGSVVGAQDYLHNLAGLTTKADGFANGCDYQVLGLPATVGNVLLGVTPSGASIGAQLAGNGLYVVLTNPSANTITTTQVTSGSTPGAFYAASLRSNEIMDLVETGLTDPANSSPATAVLLGNGDGTFKAPVYYDVSANSYALAAGFTVDDVNGDGIPDIVILNGTVGTYNGSVIPVTGTVTTLIGKGDGTFTIGPVSNLTWTDSLQVQSGVFKTGDVKDLLVGGTVLFGSGNGSFTQGPTNDTLATLNVDTAAVGGNAVGSLRNNGNLDVVVSVSGFASIFYGNGDGTFQTGPAYATGPDFMQATITDIDGDGNPDIVLGTSTGGVYTIGGYDTPIPMFQVLMGRGDGTFVDSVAYSQGSYGIAAGALNTNQEIVSEDFNGDGKLDVLVYSSSTTGGAGNLVMLPGNGTGALGTAVTSTINNAPEFVVAAKMNGDTAYDAVVAGYGANNSGPEVSVLTNQGNGTFANEKDYVLSTNPVSLAVGDFDGDGLEDVAIGESGQGVYVYFGQSNGTLGAPVQVDTSANPIGLAAGSLTTDGRTDLVVADGATATLHIYLGNSNKTFTTEPSLTTGATSLSVAALGDLDNDGKLDLIVAGFIPGTNPNPNVGNVYTFLGNGDGTFKAAVTTTITDNDVALPTMAIGDFNKDGNLDVVVGNQSDYTELLFGKGDGTFTDSLLALVQRPTTLAAADLLGNGYPEILVGEADTQGQGNSLTVLLNQGASEWTSLTTPTVTVTPSPSSITSTQSTTVTITVSGPAGGATATGSVTLASGTYTSASTTLSSGSATITVAGNALAAGTDTLTASYTPDAASASIYSSATGTGTVTVGSSASTFVLSNSGSISLEAGATTGNTATITVTPSNGYTGTVSLSCSVTTAPTGATSPVTCGIPSSVSITSASAQNSTLTANTTTPTTAGDYAITVTGTSGAITMTTVVNVTVAAYVAPSFTLTNGGPVTISSPGTSTGNTTTITVTPSEGFTGSVTLTAALTNSPPGAVDPPTFSFGSTSPVTISNSAASGSLTVSTTPATTGALTRPDWRRGVPWRGAAGATLAFVLFFAIPRRSRRWLSVLGVFLFLSLLPGFVSGCGGGSGGGTKSGSSGTTTGNYVVTVSGTSGSITKTTTVNITVN
jgi:hypothetical protein